MLLLAAYSSRERKIETVQKATVKLDALKYFLQIAWEIKAVKNKNYLEIAGELSQIGKMLGGWAKHLKTETPSKLEGV